MPRTRVQLRSPQLSSQGDTRVAAGTTSYSASVNSATTSVTFTPFINEGSATVAVNGVTGINGPAGEEFI